MTAVAPKFDHLDAGAARVAMSDDDERIRYIQRDRFVEHGAAQRLLLLLKDLALRPASIRPPCLALVGDAGSGKSTLLTEFLRLMDKVDGTSGRCSAVYLVADPRPTIEVLQSALMAALSLPRPKTRWRQRSEGDSLIRQAIRELGVRVVVIDEIAHLLNLQNALQQETWDWIKWISTACGVSIACAGIPGYERMLLKDGQLQTRFSIVRLPAWRPGPALADFLAQYERSLPLRKPSGLARMEIQQALLAETQVKQQIKGVTDGIRQVLEFAAIRAIRTEEERIFKPMLSAWRDLYG